jgi:hypothetical protein
MTLSLQKFKAYGLRCSGAQRQHTQQVVEMYIAGAATDTTWDISADTSGSLGTFWTAALADATYGQLGTSALALIQKIQAIADDLKPPVAESISGYSSTSSAAKSILALLSSAIAGGAAAQTATVTGLLTTDTLLGLTQTVANANSLTPISVGAPGSGTILVTYSADPGASGKVLVAISRTAASVAPAAGQYVYTVTSHLPQYVFAASNAPTSAYLRLNWTIPDGIESVTADLGAAF